MKVLWLASMLPTPFGGSVAPWNMKNIEALQVWAGAEVKAVCPVRLTPPEKLLFQQPFHFTKIMQWYRARKSAENHAQIGSVDITYLKWIGLPKRFFWGIEGRILYAQARQSFIKIIQEFQPDVIHVPWLNPEGIAGCLLGHEFSIPCVVQAQGSDVNLYLRKYPGKKIFFHDLKKASAVLFVCQTLKLSAENMGLSHHEMQVIYNGVDTETFQPAENRQTPPCKTIITVAKLSPVKNLGLLLDAFYRLPADVKSQTQLLLVGEGPSRQELEAQARDLNIHPFVHFIGQVEHSQVVKHLQSADIFCLSSLSEGLPFSAIEAMACGLPVVATRVGGVPEAVIEGKTGYLVESGDANALAAAIQRALSQTWDPTAIRQVVLEKFSWQGYASQMISLYQRIT